MLRSLLCAFVLLLVLLLAVAAVDPYATLGLRKGASDEQVKKAYRSLARDLHPDKNKGGQTEEKFIQVVEAYESLMNPESEYHKQEQEKEFFRQQGGRRGYPQQAYQRHHGHGHGHGYGAFPNEEVYVFRSGNGGHYRTFTYSAGGGGHGRSGRARGPEDLFQQFFQEQQQRQQYHYAHSHSRSSGGNSLLSLLYELIILTADVLGINHMLLFALLFLGLTTFIFIVIETIWPSEDPSINSNKKRKKKNQTNASISSGLSSISMFIMYTILPIYSCYFLYQYYYYSMSNPRQPTVFKLYDVLISTIFGSPLLGFAVIIVIMYAILDVVWPEDNEEERRQRQREAKTGARKASIARNEQASSSSSSPLPLRSLPTYTEEENFRPTSSGISIICDNEKSLDILKNIALSFKNDPITFYESISVSARDDRSLHGKTIEVYAVKKGGRWTKFDGEDCESQLEDWLHRMLGGEITFVSPLERKFPLFVPEREEDEEKIGLHGENESTPIANDADGVGEDLNLNAAYS